MIRYKKDNTSNWIRWLVMVVLLISLLLGGGVARPLRAQGGVTPEQIEVTLEAGKCSDERVSVTTSAAPIPKLDLVFVVDVTGSMGEVINKVTRSAGEIVANTRALVPDTAFALGTFSDYSEGDYAWRLDQDISKEEAQIQRALNEIRLQHGGDGRESYLRALYETQFLSWREGSRRMAILFGDSLPHDPDAGRDGEPGTSDDLTQSQVLRALDDQDISVMAVYTDPSDDFFYQSVAERTDGQAFLLQRTEEIPERVRQLVEPRVARISELTLDATSPEDSWIKAEPEVHHNVGPLETRDFALVLCVPEETNSGEHAFELKVKGDGALIAQIPVRVNVVGVDLAVAQSSSPDSLFVQEQLTYLLTVTNNGTRPATEISLSDQLPAGAELISATSAQGSCTPSESDAGTSVTCDLLSLADGATTTVTIVAKPTRANNAINSATVSASQADADLSNNTSSQSTTVKPVSDLSITHGPPNPVSEGDRLTYTLAIANNGPSPASGVVLNDALPAKTTFHSASPQGNCSLSGRDVTCNLGNMAENSNLSINLVVIPEEAGTIVNQAKVSASELDPDQSNNSAEQSHIVNRKWPWWLLLPALLLSLLAAGLLFARQQRKRPTAKPTRAAPPRARSASDRPTTAQKDKPEDEASTIIHDRSKPTEKTNRSQTDRPQKKDKGRKPRMR